MKCSNCQAEILDDCRFCSHCGASTHPADGSADTATLTISTAPGGALPPGTILAGKYRILEVAGRGGMGIVYKAEDTKLHRPVALKFLPHEQLPNQDARDRFLMEARAAAALSHPNICTIHEIHDEERKPFIEMEYVEGSSLKARIEERALEVSDTVDIAVQVAEALAEAHRKGVVHRDIKSANIMLTDKGQAKVMDFGLAKVSGETLHTREGSTLGTVAYMSPEQAKGERVDERTDVWSLGVVLYEMLSGCLPFNGERAAAILYAVVHEEPKPLRDARPGLPPELLHIVSRALKRDRNARYASAAEMANDLKGYRDSLKAEELSVLTPRTFWRAIRRPRIAIPAALCLALLCAAGAWFLHRQSRIRWAKEQALPEIDRLIISKELGSTNFPKAYKLATEAEKYISGDPALSGLLARCSGYIAIKTEPAGAAVYLKDVSALDREWQYLGTSPIAKIRMPFGTFWWKLEKAGYETVMAAAPSFRINEMNTRVPYDFYRVLDQQGKIPPGMVRVQGGQTDAGRLSDFFVDRYEVTNRQYKEFVDRGGYRDRKYWKLAFVKDGRALSWEEAMAQFLDQTGRPGPSTWQAGNYAPGQADYPVSGVSWYEAAAYAEYAGKSLPTAAHWALAEGMFTPLFQADVFSFGWLGRVSNFKGEGPAPVGSSTSMTTYGAYDMPGNVREWCWNDAKSGKVIRGGAWNDVAYMMSNVSQEPAFDRSPKNGFRCALYPDPGAIPEKAFQPAEIAGTELAMGKPVPDAVFQAYKELFSYDKKDLNAKIEWRKESSPDWVQEKVTVDSAYGGEKLPLYLFLPKGSSAPYQTVVYFPGSGSMFVPSSNDLEHYAEFEFLLSFIVKNGRAVVYPVYKGSFERNEAALKLLQAAGQGVAIVSTREYTELIIQQVKEVRRAVDYLESRPDIDRNRLAYLGYSYGGSLAPTVLTSEERLKAGILVLGGLCGCVPGSVRPEVDTPVHAPRVKAPILMLNGKYDLTLPLETTIKPMFDLLGTPKENKRLVVYDTDHFVPRNEYMKETLAWLDRYLGPVK